MHTITCNKRLDKGEKLTTAKHTVVNVITLQLYCNVHVYI